MLSIYLDYVTILIFYIWISLLKMSRWHNWFWLSWWPGIFSSQSFSSSLRLLKTRTSRAETKLERIRTWRLLFHFLFFIFFFIFFLNLLIINLLNILKTGNLGSKMILPIFILMLIMNLILILTKPRIPFLLTIFLPLIISFLLLNNHLWSNFQQFLNIRTILNRLNINNILQNLLDQEAILLILQLCNEIIL